MTDLGEAVQARIAALTEAEVPARIWGRDPTVWRSAPAQIADRLGWLTLHEEMRGRATELKDFARACAADGLRSVVLLGMGGSSLAPEVFRSCLPSSAGFMDLLALDSSHPDQILSVERAVDLERTLFVVASKSGTTIETISLLRHFWSRLPDGSRFVAITDPGTPLALLAEERRFRRSFPVTPDVEGRYAALSYLGLVPAALIGVELEPILDGASRMAAACGPEMPPHECPAVVLGAWMGEAALAGRDKLTLALPAATASFGPWLEQLVAGSTGKGGQGIVPVEGEALGPPSLYGDDRLFVALGAAGEGPILRWIERSGAPVLRTPSHDDSGVGAEMFRWEFATAVAGVVLGLQPFDRPDARPSNDAVSRLLAAGSAQVPEPGDLSEVQGGIRPGDYVGIQAFLPRSAETTTRLQSVRQRIRDERRVATTVGFGPRFLHSTGELHKDGPNTVVCLQVVDPPSEDVAVPGEVYTFGALLAARADVDLATLRARGRRTVRLSLTELEAATWR